MEDVNLSPFIPKKGSDPSYPNRTFIARIAAASTRVAAFHRMMGGSCLRMPKASHPMRPTLNVANAGSDTSLAERVFQIFRTCGMKATVVRKPAAKPMIVIVSRTIPFCFRVRA